MKLSYHRAPVHRLCVCAGVFAFCSQFAACERTPGIGTGDRTLVLDGDTVQLAAGVTVHDVRVRATQASDFSTAEVTAAVGDVVRFTTADTRPHGLVINAPTARAAALLNATGQHRSPPLVVHGQSWVVSLQDVPAGTYVVSCISHQGTLTLTVR